MNIDIDLTPEQQELVAPLLAAAKKANELNAPGMVVAQIHHGFMRIGFLANETAKQFENKGLSISDNTQKSPD